MSASESIIFGVVSGILTSIVLWIALTVFKKLVIPWYQSVVYRGAVIQGQWGGYYTKEKEKGQVSIIELKQKGHQVTGKIVLKKQPNGAECHKIFTCKGIIKDNNLIINYDSEDRSKLGSGSYVMTLVNDGSVLEGMSVYLSSARNEVVSIEEYWQRSSV